MSTATHIASPSDYNNAHACEPETNELDINEAVSDLITWGSTTLPLECKDVYKEQVTLELTEEITTEQLQHAFNLALDYKGIELGKYFRELLTAQAEKMIEQEIKKIKKAA